MELNGRLFRLLKVILILGIALIVSKTRASNPNGNDDSHPKQIQKEVTAKPPKIEIYDIQSFEIIMMPWATNMKEMMESQQWENILDNFNPFRKSVRAFAKAMSTSDKLDPGLAPTISELHTLYRQIRKAIPEELKKAYRSSKQTVPSSSNTNPLRVINNWQVPSPPYYDQNSPSPSKETEMGFNRSRKDYSESFANNDEFNRSRRRDERHRIPFQASFPPKDDSSPGMKDFFLQNNNNNDFSSETKLYMGYTPSYGKRSQQDANLPSEEMQVVDDYNKVLQEQLGESPNFDEDRCPVNSYQRDNYSYKRIYPFPSNNNNINHGSNNNNYWHQSRTNDYYRQNQFCLKPLTLNRPPAEELVAYIHPKFANDGARLPNDVINDIYQIMNDLLLQGPNGFSQSPTSFCQGLVRKFNEIKECYYELKPSILSFEKPAKPLKSSNLAQSQYNFGTALWQGIPIEIPFLSLY